MRSTRTMKWRSPRSASMSARAAAQAGPAATPPMSSGSGARGETKVAGGSMPSARQRGREGVRPAGGVEAAGSVPGQAVEQRRARTVGEHPQVVGSGERGVAEVHQVEIGAADGERLGQQAEVVVLHEDHGPLRCHLGHGVGEGVVHGAVGGPRRPPVSVEHGPPGQVEEAVVHEPEGGVADDVVEGPVGIGVEGEGPEPEALGVDHSGRGHFPVAVGHGGGDPDGLGARPPGARCPTPGPRRPGGPRGRRASS